MRGIFFGLSFHGPFKMLHRLAKSQCQHAVNCAQHLRLLLCQCSLARTFRCCLTQLQAKLLQLQPYQIGYLPRIFAAVCFGHYRSRHNPILPNNVGNARKLAAVTDRMLKEPLYHLIFHRLLACINDALQEQVRFLQLVIKETIILGKLHFIQAVLRHHLRTKHIQACKQPAAPGLLLVGNAMGNDTVREIRVKVSQTFMILCQNRNTRSCHRIINCLIRSRMFITAFYFFQYIRSNPSLLCLHCKSHSHQAQCHTFPHIRYFFL